MQPHSPVSGGLDLTGSQWQVVRMATPKADAGKSIQSDIEENTAGCAHVARDLGTSCVEIQSISRFSTCSADMSMMDTILSSPL